MEHQPGVRVPPHATRVDADDVLHGGDLVAEGEQHVDLLLVLGLDDLGLGVRHDEAELVRVRVLIDREGEAPRAWVASMAS